MGPECAIISDIDICKKMGWTFTELDAQPFFEVEVLRKYLKVEEEAQELARKKQKKKAKSRGRGRRGVRRRRR